MALPLFGIPSPHCALASGGKVSCEDGVLIQELDGNLLYHHVKSPTSNESTKKPHNPKSKETNQQKTFLVSELHPAGTCAVPEAAAAPRGACLVGTAPASKMAGAWVTFAEGKCCPCFWLKM